MRRGFADPPRDTPADQAGLGCLAIQHVPQFDQIGAYAQQVEADSLQMGLDDGRCAAIHDEGRTDAQAIPEILVDVVPDRIEIALLPVESVLANVKK